MFKGVLWAYVQVLPIPVLETCVGSIHSFHDFAFVQDAVQFSSLLKRAVSIETLAIRAVGWNRRGKWIVIWHLGFLCKGLRAGYVLDTSW